MKICRAVLLAMVSMAAACPALRAQFPPAPGTGPGLPETIEAIDSARVTTRILYITAHPDDESASVLTYLARGLHADVALLSLTHGEGGQNALGSEQGAQLGLIRTQELLAATRGYGVKLYFTRARDFGFSKTPEETEKIWGDGVLDDMVYLIRTFRPNIVINNWGGVHGGHGHHQAAGILTPKAIALAADESYKTKTSCEDCGPWKTALTLNMERGSEHPKGYILPLDDISPLYGRTYRQMGLDAFANHRTQGITNFLSSPFFLRPISLVREDGQPVDPKSLAVNLRERFKNCEPIQKADRELLAARADVLQLEWKEAGEKVSHAAEYVDEAPKKCGATPTIQREEAWEQQLDRSETTNRIERAAASVAGMNVTAIADRNDLTAGEVFHVAARARCRQEAGCQLGEGKFVAVWGLTQEKHEGSLDKGQNYTIQVDSDAKPAGSFLGNSSGPISAYFVSQADGPQIWVNFNLAGREYVARELVKFFDLNSTHANLVPLRIVPSYTLAIEPKSLIEIPDGKNEPVEVLLKVHSYATKPATVTVGLDVPSGWSSSESVEVKFDGMGERYAKLKVSPPGNLKEGNLALAAVAKRGEERFTSSIEPLPSMPTLLWEEPAQCFVHSFNVNVPKNLRVGYVAAESEPISDLLRKMGIQVEILGPAALAFSDLSKYDAIVVGIRSYELRSDLAGANQRLLDYVSSGGTLVVQYEREFAWDGKNYAPYPATINSNKPGEPLPRTTDENATVTFLKPDDPLLNTPNKITAKDFDGWIQERGLYYWTDFDAKYTPLLAMHDPGEKDLNGSLVYAKYGRGTYIYTGLAFFRQLPEGVPGAYRLFVNLLSASRSH